MSKARDGDTDDLFDDLGEEECWLINETFIVASFNADSLDCIRDYIIWK